MPPAAANFRAIAAANGLSAEEWVYNKIPGIEKINELLDAKFKGLDIEIKSCQSQVIDNSHKSGLRTGRFMLYEEQHNALKKTNGVYCFVVLKHGKNKNLIQKCFFIEARKIPLSIRGLKSIPWSTLYNSRQKE